MLRLINIISNLMTVASFNIKIQKLYIAGQEFKRYVPKEINNNKVITFYSGGNSIMPAGIYNQFLNVMANKNYTVYTMSNNHDANLELYETIYNKDIYPVTHSSGCVNAINDINSIRHIKRCVFMDPVNNQNVFNRVQPIPFLKSENPIKIKHLENILLLNAEYSYKWQFFPQFKTPFIPGFALTEKQINEIKPNIDISIIKADDYGHCDILDIFWSDLMHNTISTGYSDRNDETLGEYHEWLATQIDEYLKIESIVEDLDSSPSNVNIEVIQG